MTSKFFVLIAAVLLGIALETPTAFAQATRTWVSGVGDDANPCSRTAPCKTFAGAISKTAVGGEINTLDPGGFGGVTITKSISIVSSFGYAGVLVPLTSGVTVNAPTGSEVYLEGLDIEGAGQGGIAGVRMIGSGKLMVRNCLIRNFTTGIDIAGAAGSRAFVDGVTAVGNGIGIRVNGLGGVANTAFVTDSLIDASTTSAILVGATSTLVLSKSTLAGSGGLDVTAGGTAISYGDNLIRSGAPTETMPLR